MAHILLVDDEPDVLDSLSSALLEAEPQWNITPAQSVEEAISVLQSPGQYGRVDLVLTDLVIENDKTGGMKILEVAKRNDPYIEVILFTAYDSEVDRSKAYEMEVYDCIRKNIPGIRFSDELFIKAQNALEQRTMALASQGRRQEIITVKEVLAETIDRLNRDITLYPDLGLHDTIQQAEDLLSGIVAVIQVSPTIPEPLSDEIVTTVKRYLQPLTEYSAGEIPVTQLKESQADILLTHGIPMFLSSIRPPGSSRPRPRPISTGRSRAIPGSDEETLEQFNG